MLQQAIAAFLRISNSYASINISIKPVRLLDSRFDPKVHICFLADLGHSLASHILNVAMSYACSLCTHTEI